MLELLQRNVTLQVLAAPTTLELSSKRVNTVIERGVIGPQGPKGDGGTGSTFLSNNTARVDPSGNDSTGMVGDLGKPFLTVQAAINAIQALPGPPTDALIDIGNNGFGEVLTCNLNTISFVGSESQVTAAAFGSLTAGPDLLEIVLTNVQAGPITKPAGDDIRIYAYNSLLSGVDATGAGGKVFVSGFGTCECYGNVISDLMVTLSGIGLPFSSVTSNTGDDVLLSNMALVNSTIDYSNGPTVNSPGSGVTAVQTVIKTVTACATLTLIDSRVSGTNSATSTVYADVLLAPLTGRDATIGLAAGLAIALG